MLLHLEFQAYIIFPWIKKQSPSHEQLINMSRMTNRIVACHISLSCIQRTGGIFIEGREVFVTTPAVHAQNIASKEDGATHNCSNIL